MGAVGLGIMTTNFIGKIDSSEIQIQNLRINKNEIIKNFGIENFYKWNLEKETNRFSKTINFS